jgi:predicted transcriptional regulator
MKISPNMSNRCEITAKYVIPLFRSKVVKILIDEHGLTQNEVAKLLSISQASVSLYLGKKRGVNKKLDSFVDIKLVDYYARSYAEELIHGLQDKGVNYLCSLCKELSKKNMLNHKP